VRYRIPQDLLLILQGGVYIFEIYNNFGVAGWCLFFIATCECLVIGWIYGASRHWLELKKMIGETWGRAWLIASWKFFAPCICSVSNSNIYRDSCIRRAIFNYFVKQIQKCPPKTSIRCLVKTTLIKQEG